tara:strand:- start:13237 stop:14886 length:1650 start_codon:yes stop_codon:yes gene_type:complete
MEVIVKKSVLERFISNSLKENRTGHSGMGGEIEKSMDTPIQPDDQMSSQLSVDKPPVADPKFVPGSQKELGLAAVVISEEVPDSQIEYFYRMLHKLLDRVLDNHDNILRTSLAEAKVERIDDIDFEEDDETGEEASLDAPLSMENKLQYALDQIQDYFHTPAVFERTVYNILDQKITDKGQTYTFPVRYAKMIDEAETITRDLFRDTTVRKALAGLSSDERTRAALEMKKYISGFLKNPEKVTPEDLQIGNINSIVDSLEKKAEYDPEEFRKLLDAEIQKLSKKDKVSSGLLVLVGAKRHAQLAAGEADSGEEKYDDTDPDDDSDDVAELIDIAKDLEAKKKAESQRDADTWTRIAELEGFRGAAGARQFAYKPQIKMFLQSEVIKNNVMEMIISRASRAFRQEIFNRSKKGKMDKSTATQLMGTAKIGPKEKGNEIFRSFFKEIFYQPFVNNTLGAWKDETQKILSGFGVDDSKQVITKMIVGETSPSNKKIKDFMSKTDFSKARSESRKWIEDRDRINKLAIEFIKKRTADSPKVKNALDKAIKEYQ